MNPLTILSNFLLAAMNDARIGPIHISLYTALIKLWQEQSYKAVFTITRKRLMPLCKISGIATYHEKIKDLDALGYIRYEPSFDPAGVSKVSFLQKDNREDKE
jgi:hypothetical protein